MVVLWKKTRMEYESQIIQKRGGYENTGEEENENSILKEKSIEERESESERARRGEGKGTR